MWERKKLLIWGKTYPEFSRKHYETVCTGAVDADTGRLMRIYPITLRYHHDPFRKYDWIDAQVERNSSDFRPESYKIDQESIQSAGRIDTKGGWVERSKWILREENVFGSVKKLQEAEARDHTSLGLIRPRDVSGFHVRTKSEEERREWEKQRERASEQRDLFVDVETTTRDLKFMPVEYRIKFRCEELSCTCHSSRSGYHDFGILDWEIYALSRRSYAQGGVVQARHDVKAKLTKISDQARYDLHFFLGNTKQHSHTFTIVGLYPALRTKEPKEETSNQLGLF